MKKIIYISIIITALTATLSQAAIVITGVNTADTVTGTEASDYRSTGVAKTYDIDGDNVYGTDGNYFIGDGVKYTFSGGGSGGTSTFTTSDFTSAATPSMVTSITQDAAVTTRAAGNTYDAFDDPSAAIGATVTDWDTTAFLAVNTGSGSGGTYSNLLSFDLVSTAYDYTLRLGVMVGNEASVDGRWSASGIRVSDGSTTITTDSLGTALQMVFFDIAVGAGDTGTITIAAQTRDLASNANEKGGGIAGLTFDVAVVPEPSSLALLLLASSSCLFMRSRKSSSKKAA